MHFHNQARGEAEAAEKLRRLSLEERVEIVVFPVDIRHLTLSGAGRIPGGMELFRRAAEVPTDFVLSKKEATLIGEVAELLVTGPRNVTDAQGGKLWGAIPGDAGRVGEAGEVCRLDQAFALTLLRAQFERKGRALPALPEVVYCE